MKEEDTLNPNPIGYLTHFPTKQSKFWVVYDGSAKYEGTCLNDHILSGPDLLQPLTHVLSRFRKGKIVFMVDITDCFFQILLPHKCHDMFQIL